MKLGQRSSIFRNELTWCRSKNQAWSRQLQKSVESEAPGKRIDISGGIQLMADGGNCPWTQWRCHLEETSLKEANITNDKEKEYLLRIRNPDNPFSGPCKELTYSVEFGIITTNTGEVPRITWSGQIEQRNRKEPATDIEDANKHKQGLKIVENINLAITIEKPTSRDSFHDYFLTHLQHMRTDRVLSQDEEGLYRQGIMKMNLLTSEHDDWSWA